MSRLSDLVYSTLWVLLLINMKWITEMCPRYGDTTMKNEDVIRVCMQVKKLEEIHMRDRYMWY